MYFKLQTQYIELYKLLKAVNLCSSGGEAKHFIATGCVKVDGIVETRKACKIRNGQIVSFEEHEITVKSPTISL